MRARFETQSEVFGRNHAGGLGTQDHLVRTAEARHRQAQTIAAGLGRLWTTAQRSLGRLIAWKWRGQTGAADRERISESLGRAGVADALRRDLVALRQLVRRLVLEPLARRRRRRHVIAQLRSLDDRLLADIGLMRGQIELAVDGMLARPRKPLPWPVGPAAVPADATRDELPLAA
jgi:uncharacterized protein YjiS (DUF1127 family)